MSGKNLIFKLVMDADTKGLVQNTKSAEKAFSDLQQAVSQGTISFEREAKKTSEAISDIVPSETKQKVAQLVTELHSVSKALMT